MNDDQRAGKIRALLVERESLQRRGLGDRVAQVDEQLRLLGAQGKPPVKRAVKR